VRPAKGTTAGAKSALTKKYVLAYLRTWLVACLVGCLHAYLIAWLPVSMRFVFGSTSTVFVAIVAAAAVMSSTEAHQGRLCRLPSMTGQGRPVTYSCISQGETGGLVPADCVMHAAFLIENMVPSIRGDASTYVWILDFTGIVRQSCIDRKSSSPAELSRSIRVSEVPPAAGWHCHTTPHHSIIRYGCSHVTPAVPNLCSQATYTHLVVYNTGIRTCGWLLLTFFTPQQQPKNMGSVNPKLAYATNKVR